MTLTKEVENTGEFRNNNKKKSMAIEFLKFQGNFSKLSTYYIVFFTPYLFQIDKIHFDVTHFCVQIMYVELSRVLNLAILNRYESKVNAGFFGSPCIMLLLCPRCLELIRFMFLSIVCFM